MSNSHAVFRAGLVVGLFISSLAVVADEAPNLHFKGTLIEPPPCVINSGGRVYVDFGDKVGVKKVASGLYRQPVALNIQCESREFSGQLLLSWSGTPASFDPTHSTIVTEEQTALGVQLLLDDKPFPMDEPVPINGQASPRLEAVLVHGQSETQLQEGTFSAKGIIKAEYQ